MNESCNGITLFKGEDGKTVLNGSGAPLAGNGNIGDFYIDTDAPAIYGPKTSAGWGSATPLTGPASTVPGPTGNGISNVAWTSNSGGNPQGTAGTTDTYTITYTDASTNTFIVTNGANGANGIRILFAYNSATGIANTSGATTVNAVAISIPGSTLYTNGDEYEMDLYTEYIASDPITLEIGIGAGAVWTKIIDNANNDKRFFKIKVARIDQNNQMWTISALTRNAVTKEVIEEMAVIYTTKDLSTTEDWTVNLVNAGGVAGANALRLHRAVLYLNKLGKF
jgi:hypothetical protein